jgi:hypothetical protein
MKKKALGIVIKHWNLVLNIASSVPSLAKE